ncbi:hypothetical protein ACAG39_04905 [Caldicellulosiruptoraceae bacterium PP1]
MDDFKKLTIAINILKNSIDMRFSEKIIILLGLKVDKYIKEYLEHLDKKYMHKSKVITNE